MAAVTCLSVLEHGVPLVPFLSEVTRILRPGGILALSTDYDENPPQTDGKSAYGQPVHIFSPAQIKDLVANAQHRGLSLLGDLTDLSHDERPVRWRRMGLDFTFILLIFKKSPEP